MVVIQTTIDRRAMTALARVTRRTVRRGRNGPVRMMAWFVVLLEGFWTVIFFRAGLDWLANALLGLVMLACILGEDRVNGAIGLRRTPPESREVNTAFSGQESCYICRSRSGESWWPYRQIRVAAETKDYLVLLTDRKHGQVFDKRGLTWGTVEELRDLIRKKTGLKIQTIK